MKRPATMAFVLLALAAAAVPSPAAELLPDVSVHLRAARYVPAEDDQHWQGWIGGGADVLEVAGTRAYFTADVETIIGGALRTFDANQANYHLEAGLRRKVGRGALSLVFHHVSRHLVDRPKTQAVDWNVLGLRAQVPFTAGPAAGTVVAGIGHTTLASLVGYEWELYARVDADLVRGRQASLFAAGEARGLTVGRPEPGLFRDGFLDLEVEGGLRFRRGSRLMDLFAGWERRNDVFLERPGARDRTMFAFRVSYNTDPRGTAAR